MGYADARRDGNVSAEAEPSTGATSTRTLRPGDLLVVASYLRTQARSIATVTLLVLAVVLAGWALFPAKYRATALVTLDPRSPRLMSDEAQAAAADSDGSAVVSLVEVATSDGALIPLMRDQNLLDDPEFKDGSNGAASAMAAELRRNLKVIRRGLTYVIDVSVSSYNAEKAARIANAVADDIVRRQRAARQSASGGVAEALQSRLVDMRAAALTSETAVADYRQKIALPNGPADARIGQRRLASLAEQVGPIRARLEDARARYDLARRVRDIQEKDAVLLRSDLLSDLIRRRSEEKRQLATIARVYGPRHPSADIAQAGVASIEEQIRAEHARIIEESKNEVDTLTREITAYEAEIGRRTQDQLDLDQKEVKLNDLLRQADADRQLYEQFLTRQKSAQEQTDLTQPEAVVVSRAVPPTKTNGISVALIGLIGLLMGLALSIFWSLYRVRRDDRRVTMYDARRIDVAYPA